MTEKFERYIYPLLHTKPSDYFGSEYGSVGDDLALAWRRLGVKYPEDICQSCENRSECIYRSHEGHPYVSCDFYERKPSFQ